MILWCKRDHMTNEYCNIKDHYVKCKCVVVATRSVHFQRWIIRHDDLPFQRENSFCWLAQGFEVMEPLPKSSRSKKIIKKIIKKTIQKKKRWWELQWVLRYKRCILIQGHLSKVDCSDRTPHRLAANHEVRSTKAVFTIEMDMWLKTLNLEIKGNELVMYNYVGKGYFLLSNNENDAIHNIVMLPPFESEWGTCMLQS
jgi:hypothetical protein